MTTTRLLTAVLTAALALTAAPLTAAPLASATTPSAAPKPPKHRHLNLTNQDNRQSLAVHKGDEITVRLSGERTPNSTWSWTVPTAADGTVLRRGAVGTAPNGDTTAVFHAQADGTTTLDSQLRCVADQPGHVCSQAVVPWQTTVRVRR
ncbi:hypothetical protein [Streptomyces hesseae]|uniref:Proteinase inhibitor I42 chagasin domain-containing protein n=1 Tax=Streptomyces hesseae TaxID=3075519 RepID=A0ABU2SL25_9ACTN|nr:hypothetical protein [Streptomyces sp. DSM 40473]MDT0449681.1 hypothetical protein [Streptomyces sp. DSM 40473]